MSDAAKTNGMFPEIEQQLKLTGRPLRVPPDKHLVACVIEGMTHKGYADEQAKAVGVGSSVFRLVKRLIVLSRLQSISYEHRETVEALLRDLDNRRVSVRKARPRVRELESHYAVGDRRRLSMNPRPTKNQVRQLAERFSITLINMSEACQSTEEMKLPELEHGRRMEAIATLTKCQSLIASLVTRLIGEEGEDG